MSDDPILRSIKADLALARAMLEKVRSSPSPVEKELRSRIDRLERFIGRCYNGYDRHEQNNIEKGSD